MDFKHELDNYAEKINAYLSAALENDDRSIVKAMKYSLCAGGKRIRPMLTLEFCRLCGGDIEKALPFAAAIEMIHTYSLIHDDLPCMDDDDYRRGRLTSHKVFGEATAVLAGDALLTLAFQFAAEADLEPEKKVKAVTALACAAGYDGMVGGQVIDMESEGKEVSLETIAELEAKKTGALIKCAAELGCIAAGADVKARRAALEYADCIGRTFQIVDDLLDSTGDKDKLGKAVGVDSVRKKSTYVSHLGVLGAKQLAHELTDKAVAAAGLFDDNAFIITFAQFLLTRDH